MAACTGGYLLIIGNTMEMSRAALHQYDCCSNRRIIVFQTQRRILEVVTVITCGRIDISKDAMKYIPSGQCWITADGRAVLGCRPSLLFRMYILSTMGIQNAYTGHSFANQNRYKDEAQWLAKGYKQNACNGHSNPTYNLVLPSDHILWWPCLSSTLVLWLSSNVAL